MLAIGELDEFVGHKSVTQRNVHDLVAVAQPEHETLACGAERGTGERSVEVVSLLGNGACDELERVTCTGPREGCLDDDLAALEESAGLA
jgi:hypothetical protein